MKSIHGGSRPILTIALRILKAIEHLLIQTGCEELPCESSASSGVTSAIISAKIGGRMRVVIMRERR